MILLKVVLPRRYSRPMLLSGPAAFFTPGLRLTTASQPVVIRVPRSVQVRVENIKQMKNKLKSPPAARAGRLLIRSKNPQLNQTVAFTLGKFHQAALTSQHWKSSKTLGDYFSILNTHSVPPFVFNPESEDKPATAKTFNCFKLSSELIETLQSQNITNPTKVQMQTIPKILRGLNVLCAAETGSGKTLAYLLPIIHKILSAKQEEEVTLARNTQCVVVVPSRELAEQVTSVARSISRPFRLLVKLVEGGKGVGSIKAAIGQQQPDVVVATPGALVKALRRRFLHLNQLRFLVIDEADTMFDASFSDLLEEILSHAHVAARLSNSAGIAPKAQLVVIGATFPGGVGDVLGKVTDVSRMVVVKSQMLHRLMPHVKQTFLRVIGAEKILELHKALKKAQLDQRSVLVFCNSASTVNWLGYSLEEMGLRHTRLQGEMPAVMREGIFRNFQKDTAGVLVCTDIASRGLDTQKVGLVINYDFPESHTDYIHRAGRVGRAGSSGSGEVLSFVTHPWDVERVQKIETAARRRLSLPGMESEIKRPIHKTDLTE